MVIVEDQLFVDLKYRKAFEKTNPQGGEYRQKNILRNISSSKKQSFRPR